MLLYAYATGTSPAPGCPAERRPSQGCSLGQALSQAHAGATVALATPGNSGHYVGNWTVATLGTSSSAPLTIAPAPGITNPILDGNQGESVGCQTKACAGPVLTMGPNVYVDLDALSVVDADNATNGLGGARQNNQGGTLKVSGAKFLGDHASGWGGAIDNGDVGTGTLVVSASTFSANSANDHGAPGQPVVANVIDNNGFNSGFEVNGSNVPYGHGEGIVWTAADIFDGSCANSKVSS
jgi:hypothetical protein